MTIPNQGGSDVTVCIASYNAKHLLDGCLSSLKDATHQAAYDVTVVENASDDGTVDWLAATFPQVSVIQNAHNRGFTAATNQALERATGRYLLLLNTDVILHDGALDLCVDYMDDHPRVGAVGCRILNRDGTLQPSCECFPTLRYVFRAGLLRRWSRVGYPDDQYDREFEPDWICAAFMLVRKDAIDAIGCMDERFWHFWSEVDWCKRMRESGWRVAYVPNAVITHFGWGTTWQMWQTIKLDYHLGRQYFYRKHYGRTARLGLLGLTVIAQLQIIALELIGVIRNRTDRRKSLQNIAVALAVLRHCYA